MTIKITKGTAPQWWAAWKGFQFTVSDEWPHTSTHWAVMELPQGENEDSPQGYMMCPKIDCEVVK